MGSYTTTILNTILNPNAESCIMLEDTMTVIYELSQYNKVNVKIDTTLRIDKISNEIKTYTY